MPGLVGSETLSQHFTNNFSLHTTLTLDTVMNRERPKFFWVLFQYTNMRYRFQYVSHDGESRVSTLSFLTPSRKE